MNAERPRVVCVECDHEIECCEFCDSEECKKPVCFECLRAALGETMSHPHRHGG